MKTQRTLKASATRGWLLVVIVVCTSLIARGQSVTASASSPASAATPVPRLIRFNGAVRDQSGKPMTGIVGITFALYKDQDGGPALWIETQNAQLDLAGHYTALLGETKADGLPIDLFTSGGARWLGVTPNGQAEQPRVALLSVPYALEAGDAATLGGLPASAFLAGARGGDAGSSGGGINPALSGGGKPGFIASWKTATTLTNSKLFQNPAGNLGVGTTKPAASLDVNGTSIIRNTLTLFPKGSAPTFSVNGTAFNISNAGLVSFVTGQAFPGTGTITGVTAGTDLTGGGTSGAVTLNLDTTKVPQLNANNNFTSNQTVSGSVTATSFSGNGAGLTNVNAAQLGGLASGAFAQLAANNTFAGTQTVNNTVSITAGGGVQAFGVNATGNTNGIQSKTAWASGYAIVGTNTATTGGGGGVLGQTSTLTGAGVTGNGVTGVLGATSVDFGAGVLGVSTSPTVGTGVLGTSTTAYGVSGVSPFHGVSGVSTSTLGGVGVEGDASGTGSAGVYGLVKAASGNGSVSAGVYGVGAPSPSAGVVGVGATVSLVGRNYINTLMGTWGDSSGGIGLLGTSDSNTALFGINNAISPTLYLRNNRTGLLIDASGLRVEGSGQVEVAGNALYTEIGDPSCGAGTAAIAFTNSGFDCNNYALRGDSGGNLYINSSSTGWMFFDSNNTGLMSLDPSGNLSIKGNLSKGGGSFKIDHPLDPANKYLYHSFVESPDMMNVYNGVVTLHANGSAWIVMPEYFEALNRDFRYQLTAMGRPQPNLYIATQVAGNRFKIAGGKPNGKVSWQVTGIRQDAWANAHRIPVEVAKPEAERGHYLHPELYETAAEPRQ